MYNYAVRYIHVREVRTATECLSLNINNSDFMYTSPVAFESHLAFQEAPSL